MPLSYNWKNVPMRKLKNKLIAPVLKWVGGKRQLLNTLNPLLPQRISTYCEPFVGGGALLFSLQPNTAYINDINYELINVYNVIKSDVETLIETLHDFRNEVDYFYAVRDWDRDKYNYSTMSEVKKAARILYLNKTCYNGLFRVNSAGEFNSPFGNYQNPNIVNAPTLRAVSSYLNKATIRLTSLDYSEALENLPKEAFVYLDPPYDPISDTSSFTGYSKGGFTRCDQIKLRKCCDELNARGIKFMLSNSATDFIKEQYATYNITIVRAKRAINSDAAKRGEIDEIVVRNYE
ncbi:MAG: DNA adenine methylase [Chitinispirillales bacterium]|jgi:DNA adenine methylase|nr:DNA adenine methylase [Chitinispirillales bacterium]